MALVEQRTALAFLPLLIAAPLPTTRITTIVRALSPAESFSESLTESHADKPSIGNATAFSRTPPHPELSVAVPHHGYAWRGYGGAD